MLQTTSDSSDVNSSYYILTLSLNGLKVISDDVENVSKSIKGETDTS